MMPDTPPSPSARVPAKVWLAILLSAVLESAMQLIWKSAANSLDPNMELGEKALAFVTQPRFIILIVMVIAQFINWMRVLSMADLSFAKPISSLSYFVTASGAMIFLGEHVTIQRWLGISVIFLGIWLISGTGHKTNLPTDSGGQP